MTASDEGDVRIVFTDTNESNRRVVYQAPTESLDISTDPRQCLIVPFSAETLHQDDLMIVEVKGRYCINSRLWTFNCKNSYNQAK